MIGAILILSIFLILVFTFFVYYFKLKVTWLKKIFAFIFPENQTLKETAMTLVSIGSATGIGIGLIFSYFFGSNLLFGIIFIVIGLSSLKQNWFLMQQ